MIIVTGATGALGGRIVDLLLDHVPADEIGVSVRDVDKAAALAERGVRVRAGDFQRPDTLAHAFEGADQVLVISASIRGFEEAVAANRAAVDAAVAAGARRVLYTSHQAAASDSLFAPMLVHAAAEEHLAGLGTAYTSLRHGFYASTLGMFAPAALASGSLVAPEDGPVSWTAHADLAEAAAAALTQEGTLDGISPPLTAPTTLDLEAVAGVLTELSGRTIERVVAGDDEWRATAVANGMPEAAADFTLGLFRAARRGEFAVTDPTLEDLLGHPATSVRTVLGDMVA